MGTSVLAIPDVQAAIDFALEKLAAWQDVPARLTADRAALVGLAGSAQQVGDVQGLAELAGLKQALDGIQQQYLDSSALMATVLRTARQVQATGQSPDAGAIADAGRLAAIIASGLGALQATEQALVARGADLTVGPGGTTVPAWVKMLGGAAIVYFIVRQLS